ncbi:hypothetical protein DPMN_157308 [Dreissena polymorpha]|uniref:Glycogen debranching enzyme central domain-containing protein n=1 Tax=Dreissena polymorpha TaxID=45954 RepID=A0A9D4EK35_DREPO|nr:hypothetical protein DPMN_157308 [Dreissena polymorpha]
MLFFIAGVSTVLGSIRAHNDLGHALCNNLREGDWLPSYIAKRLLVHPGTYHVSVHNK